MKHSILLLLLTLLVLPYSALASHNSYGRIDTSDLDDDPVKKIPIPVLFGVDINDVIPDFGAPRGGGTREHEGQDFLAPQGTPIVSPTEAVVIRTGTGASSGKYVYTANPGGEVFRYMHLDSFADLDPGDELDVGDFIGTVGDTGNAAPGAYHLHFEIRDEDNDATDPYPRLRDEFTLKEKMSFLRGIVRDFKSSKRDDYAEFLVETFAADFREAVQEEYELPDSIEDAVDDAGIVNTAKLQDQLNKLIASIPQILNPGIVKPGDSGAAVQLLQIYLIYVGDGPAHTKLVGAGPTGYYGSITEAAIKEYQHEKDLLATGVYNQNTRDEMMDFGK